MEIDLDTGSVSDVSHDVSVRPPRHVCTDWCIFKLYHRYPKDMYQVLGTRTSYRTVVRIHILYQCQPVCRISRRLGYYVVYVISIHPAVSDIPVVLPVQTWNECCELRWSNNMACESGPIPQLSLSTTTTTAGWCSG